MAHFFNSQSVSALTIEEQSEVMSFPVSPFKHRCSASWSLRDILTNFTYGGSYGSQNSSNYASEYKSYIAPKFDNLKYLIVRGTSSYTIYDVKVIVIYRNHDKYKMFVKKNGTIHYKKNNRLLYDTKDNTPFVYYEPTKNFSNADITTYSLVTDGNLNRCHKLPILESSNSGLSSYSSYISNSWSVWKTNIPFEYEDGYDGPRIPLESNISTDSLSFQPVLSGQIKGQELSAVVEPDNMISDIDYFSAQKYQYKLFKFNNNNYDIIDTKVLKFGEVYKYNFNSESSNGLYKVEVLPILQVPYRPKYNFISSYIPLEYSGFSTNSYFSTKNVPFGSTSNFSFENCDALDVPCHIRNVITTISKAFYDFGNFLRNFLFKDVLGFIKFLFIPSFDDIKSYYLSFIDSIKLSLGGLYGFGESVSLSMTSFFKMIYPSFSSDYTPPCRFIPNFNVFGSPMSIDLCSFEKSIGTSNFNLIRGFVSISFVFSSLFISRGILFRFFSMLGDS